MPAPQLLLPLGLLVLLLVVQALFVSMRGELSRAALALCLGYTLFVYYLAVYLVSRRADLAGAVAAGLLAVGWGASRVPDLGYLGPLVLIGPGGFIAHPVELLHARLLAWRVGEACGVAPDALEQRPGVHSQVEDAAALPDGRVLVVLRQEIRGTDVAWHKLVRLLPSGELDPTFAAARGCLPSDSLAHAIDDLAADGALVLGPSRGSSRHPEQFLAAAPDGTVAPLDGLDLAHQDLKRLDLARVRRHPSGGALAALVHADRFDSGWLDDPRARLELRQAGAPPLDLRPLLRTIPGEPVPAPDFLYLPDGRLVMAVAAGLGEGRADGVATLDPRTGAATWVPSQGRGLAPVGAFPDGSLLLAGDLARDGATTAAVLEVLSPIGESLRLNGQQLRAAFPGFRPRRALARADGGILLVGEAAGRLEARTVERDLPLRAPAR